MSINPELAHRMAHAIRARRVAEAAQAEYDRAVRADAQRYEWIWPGPPGGPALCHNPATGGIYQLTLTTCTCPDYQYRCRGLGIDCKHLIDLVQAIPQGVTIDV